MVETNCEVAIPVTSAEITAEWISNITGVPVAPGDIQIEGEIQAGFGFLSSICRVAFKTTSGQSRSIIIKLLPTDPERLESALADGSDEREICFYTTVLPDLLKIIPELCENVCEFYYGAVRPPTKDTPKASILVMEDLKALGYEMMAYKGDIKGADSLITALTRLHVGSLAVEARMGTPLLDAYPVIQGGDKNFNASLEPMCKAGFGLLRDLLASENVAEEVIECYEKLEPYTSIMINKLDKQSKVNPCMVHGDLWPANVQVHESLPAKLIDWQLVGYRHPAIDLLGVIYWTLPMEELNRENIGRLLKRYKVEAEKLCRNKGLEDTIKLWDWEEFDQFCFSWGAGYVFMVLLTSLESFDKDKPKDANILKVMFEEHQVPQFLLKECQKISN